MHAHTHTHQCNLELPNKVEGFLGLFQSSHHTMNRETDLLQALTCLVFLLRGSSEPGIAVPLV